MSTESLGSPNYPTVDILMEFESLIALLGIKRQLIWSFFELENIKKLTIHIIITDLSTCTFFILSNLD